MAVISIASFPLLPMALYNNNYLKKKYTVLKFKIKPRVKIYNIVKMNKGL